MSWSKKFFLRIGLLAMLVTGVSSCSGGRIGLAPLSVVLFNFAPGFGGVQLNAPLELTLSVPVDGQTVTSDTVRIFTTTTTTNDPDPGAPAQGEYIVVGNVIRFLPDVPQIIDAALLLTDAGLRIGFTYTVQVPAAPAVIEPIRSIEGDPNLINYTEFFTTLNSTILPSPANIGDEPNLISLSLLFIDEGIENGADPCDRAALAPDDRDSPQVVDTDPIEGEGGFGTITGIQAGLEIETLRLRIAGRCLANLVNVDCADVPSHHFDFLHDGRALLIVLRAP